MNPKPVILITRTLDEHSAISTWCSQNHFTLIQQAFIETKAISGLSIPSTDWVFFSSPQGVKLYFEQYSLLAKHIAALSNGTAKTLSELSLIPEFIGPSNKSPEEIGRNFFAQLDSNQSVLFPLSSISRKNVSSQKKGHPVIELVTYETSTNSVKIACIPDIILFTSPSNVDGFLTCNTLHRKTKILALGLTTALHLRAKGYSDLHIAESTHESQLVLTLKRLCSDVN